MTGLPGNLGNIDFDGLVKLFKNARDTGQSVLEEALKALANDQRLKAVVDQLQNLLGKPVIKLTDAELDDLINSRHAGNQAKSKPFPKSGPKPPPVDDGEGNPAFRYSPDTLTKEEIETAMAATPRQIKQNAEIYGDGKTWETSRLFQVYYSGGLGSSPRDRGWGEPLKIMP